MISGREEASLLAHGYLERHDTLPALIADIGGGSLELVYLGEDRSILRDSLPLGAIRLHHLGLDRTLEILGEAGPASEGQWDQNLVTSFIDSSFDDASLVSTDEIFATGGTAIVDVLEKTSFTGEELDALARRIRTEGPPPVLKPDRAEVFLPGVLVLARLIAHARAEKLTYLKIPAGRIFLRRLAQRLARGRNDERKRFMMRDLRITAIYPRKTGIHPALDSRLIQVDPEQDEGE